MFRRKDPRLIAAEAIPRVVSAILEVDPQYQANVLGSAQILCGARPGLKKGLPGLLGIEDVKQTWEDTETPGGMPIDSGNGKGLK